MSVCAMPQEASCMSATAQTMSESAAGRSPCTTSNMDPPVLPAHPVLYCPQASQQLTHNPQPSASPACDQLINRRCDQLYAPSTDDAISIQQQQQQLAVLQEHQKQEHITVSASTTASLAILPELAPCSATHEAATQSQQAGCMQPPQTLQPVDCREQQGDHQQYAAHNRAQQLLNVEIEMQDVAEAPEATETSAAIQALGTAAAVQGVPGATSGVFSRSSAAGKTAQQPLEQRRAAVAGKSTHRLGGLKASGNSGVSSSSGRLGGISRSGRLGSLNSAGSSRGGMLVSSGSISLGGCGSTTSKRLGTAGQALSVGLSNSSLPKGDSRVLKPFVQSSALRPAPPGVAGHSHCSMPIQPLDLVQASIAACANSSANARYQSAAPPLQEQQQPTLAELAQLAAQARAVSPGLLPEHGQQQQSRAPDRTSRSPSPPIPPSAVTVAGAADTQPQQQANAVVQRASRSPSPAPAVAAAALQSAFSSIRCWSPALKPSHNSLRSRSSSPALAQGVEMDTTEQQPRQTQCSSRQSPAPYMSAAVGQRRVRFNEHLQVFYLPPEARQSSKRSSSDSSSRGTKKSRSELSAHWQGDTAAEAVQEDEGQQHGEGTAVESVPAHQHQGHLVAASYAPELSWRKARKYKQLAQAAAEGDELPDDLMAAAATAIAMTAAGRQIIQQQQGTSTVAADLPAQPAQDNSKQPNAAVAADADMPSSEAVKQPTSSRKKRKKPPRHVNPAVAAAAAAVGDAEGDALISCYKSDVVWSPWHQHMAPPQPLEKGSKEAAAIEKMMLEEDLDPQTAAAVMTWLYKEKKAPEVDVVRHRVQRFKAVIAPYRRPSMIQWLRKCPRLLNNAEATLSTAVAQLLALFSPGLMLPAQAAELLDRCPQLAARTAAVTKTKVDLFCELFGSQQVAPLLLRFPVMLTMSRDRIMEVVKLASQMLTDTNELSQLLVAKLKESLAATATRDAMTAAASTIAATKAGGEVDQQHQQQPTSKPDVQGYDRHQQNQQPAEAYTNATGQMLAETAAAAALPADTVSSPQQNGSPAVQPPAESQHQQASMCSERQQQEDQTQQQQDHEGTDVQPQQQHTDTHAQQPQQEQQQEQQCQAPLDLLMHMLMLYPAFFIHNPVKVAQHYRRYQRLPESWQFVSSVTGLLTPMMLNDWHYELFEARVHYLEQQGLLASVRDPSTKGCQVSLVHLSSSLFEEKFPGFAAWRQQEKGIPVQQTLTELISSKSKSKDRKRQKRQAQAAAAKQQLATEGDGEETTGGGAGRSSKKRAAAAAAASSKRKQQRLNSVDVEDETDEEELDDWSSGSGSDDDSDQETCSTAADSHQGYEGSKSGVLGDQQDTTDEGAAYEGYMHHQHHRESGLSMQSLGYSVSNATSAAAAASTGVSIMSVMQGAAASKRRQQPERGKSKMRQQQELEKKQEQLLQQMEREDEMVHELLWEQQQQQLEEHQPGHAAELKVAAVMVCADPASPREQQQQQQLADIDCAPADGVAFM